MINFWCKSSKEEKITSERLTFITQSPHMTSEDLHCTSHIGHFYYHFMLLLHPFWSFKKLLSPIILTDLQVHSTEYLLLSSTGKKKVIQLWYNVRVKKYRQRFLQRSHELYLPCLPAEVSIVLQMNPAYQTTFWYPD